MIRTRLTELLGIQHPVVLAGMGGGTSPELAAAVSGAGGLGILAVTGAEPERVAQLASEIRSGTGRPFGLNLLLCFSDWSSIEAVLDARPAVLSTAWARADQELAPIFAEARRRGVTTMHMTDTVAGARAAAAAGADLVVAQGTEGGGHVGAVGTAVIVPAVVRAVAPVPVIAAGGLADGAGLAAMLALGAEGVLLGTRFLATDEAPVPRAFKDQIVRGGGEDTIVTDVTDILQGLDWPGALARVSRNRLVERWLGRSHELRRHRAEAQAHLRDARQRGDVHESVLYSGQTSALIDSIVPAGQVVRETVEQAEALLRERLPKLLG